MQGFDPLGSFEFQLPPERIFNLQDGRSVLFVFCDVCIFHTLFFKLPCPLPPPGSVFSVIRLPLPVVCPQITFEFEVGFFSLVYFNIIYLPRSISLLIIVNKYAIVIIRKLCWKMDKNQCFDNRGADFLFFSIY